jgi:hypothetical protein
VSERPATGGALEDDYLEGSLFERTAKGRRRRSTEPTPDWVSCRWLAKCAGADVVHDQWLALGMWAPPLIGALRLPRFGRKYPCAGCPITRDEAAA